MSFTDAHISWYLHVGILLGGREAREVEPRHVLPSFVVVSLVLQVPKGGATESVQLQSVLVSLWTGHDVDIYRKARINTSLQNTDESKLD